MHKTDITENNYSKTKFSLAVFLVLFFVFQSAAIALKKSNTFDEPAHILSGYAYLKKGMDYLSPLNHPVFGRLMTAVLPATLLHLDFDPSVKPEEARDSNFFPYSLKFLYENNAEGRKILFFSRLPNIILGAILGIYVFLWAAELWGLNGGLLSLFFYSLAPDILAHSSLATTDLPITAFFFISAFYLYRLTERVTIPRVMVTAFFVALAFTSKHTAFLLIPFVFASLVINLRQGQNLKVVLSYLLMFVSLYVFIWAIYGFRYHSGGPHYEPLLWQKFSSSGFMPVFDLLRKFKLLPESYLYGVMGTLTGAFNGRPAFLMGRYSSTGWWYYFITAFLIKTPVPTIILLASSVLFASIDKENRRKAWYLILPALLIFVIVSMQRVDIGLRHVLPALPFVFVLIGFVPYIKTTNKNMAAAVLCVCCIWYAYADMSIYPHQLAYFNEFVGGPGNGYKYLVDSNLDWGQDLAGLKQYMDEHRISSIKLSYFGFSDPRYYGIEYEYLPSFYIPNPKNVKNEIPLDGYFAISTTMLQGVYLPDRDLYKVFRELKPIGTVGYSIFIYRL